MQYMLLIYEPHGAREGEARVPMERWLAFNGELQAAGAYVGGNGLEPVDTATTVRVRDGETLVTDGPFAETKELLGGYYLIDVPDLDAALGWAAKVPNATSASIEVRPVLSVPAEAPAG